MAGVRPIDRMASHVLVSSLVARDLNKLNSAKHCDPDQLKDNPDIEYQGKGISSDIVT